MLAEVVEVVEDAYVEISTPLENIIHGTNQRSSVLGVTNSDIPNPNVKQRCHMSR